MISWAPITKCVDLFTRPSAPIGEASSSGLSVLHILNLERGHGEDPKMGNNRGLDLERYRTYGGGKPGKSWCASFVGYGIRVAELRTGEAIPVKSTPGARKLFRRIVKAGNLIELEDLEPGDIVLWARGPDGSWQAHIGIVSQVLRVKGHVVSWAVIEGNSGKFPAKVRQSPGHRRPRLIGFARLP